jgi:hypothetical protein
MLYPIGTNISDITHFDRGIKVYFGCKEHPQYEYMSKEPCVSQWFPANEATQNLQWGAKDECPHKYPSSDVWFTTREYESIDPTPATTATKEA